MKKSEKKSTLEEKDGINSAHTLGEKSISKIQLSRKKQPTAKELSLGIFANNKASLSRAITLIESTNSLHLKKANEIIESCLKHQNKTIRIGITGVPGVGKSTFIEAFGKLLTAKGKKVAVLAVDPTSSLSKGSILGDKTRMESLVKDENAFIRPSPSGLTLGGVARKTRETIILCEAAGYNIILIETVGVGQSETAVHSMVDFFLLLKLSGAGDELQGIKRGIMEMADAIAVNKADGANIQAAKNAKIEFTRALHLYPPKENGWTPKVLQCSAIEKNGINDIWETVETFLKETNSFISKKRKEQNRYWLIQTIENQLKTNFYQNKEIQKQLDVLLGKVITSQISPFVAAEILLERYKKL
ncbi:methylmalonyl Co-A mutase-associated GTPase MeaB [Cellulophaga sp. HaHaR_3_176]|uniref:methylmalonyl Co-A mutase-associated GTPase MeaB n=1 Tax=Cellulophaga sp. HaHaR_3_176 TaxID=1942464 RepID=UPI001C2003BE|nr:methylmalonyl Co-A mutase-associated GTPase MeaB [Cellulophaga sp. HaHaR_3_176]QWX84562.1 methylmalonyl Co-A mutase-associated GTPase MeaB [Cellulophaga sp. HaHaR_3_176]